MNRIGFGALRLVGEHARGPHPEPLRCRAVLKALEGLAIDLIDTSDAYGPFLSETMIGESLAPYPPGMVVATKGGTIMQGERTVIRDGSADHLRRACEASLRRLRLDAIPLYQLHHVDPRVPLTESVGALDDLRQEGKILHIGLSNVNTDQLAEAVRIAPISAVQNRYNIVDKQSQPVLDVCERLGIAFLASQPLGGIRSLLSEVSPIRLVADRQGVSESEVALAWLLAKSPVLVAIPGTASIEHLAANARSASLRLDAADLTELESVPHIPWRSSSQFA